VHVDIIDDVSVNLGNDTLICSNQTLQLMPQLINADSLHWSTSGDGVFSNDAIAEPFYTPGNQDVLNGIITLSLYAEAFAPCEGNASDNLEVIIDPCTNVNELNGAIRFNVYPNPSSGILNIDISGITAKTFTLSLMNVEGKVLFSGILNTKNDSYSNSINLTYLPIGVYYVSILTEKERVIKKIVFE
jgi:hypothetical protein